MEVGGVLISSDILTERFCCDYERCKGVCCVEGDAGAPVTIDEVAAMEDALDAVWADLSASAQSVIDRQGVAYSDRDGDLVTSIVGGRDCVFTCYEGDNCLCALERACRAGRTQWPKPISCALYPIREKNFGGGLVGLNYHRWSVCRDPWCVASAVRGTTSCATWREAWGAKQRKPSRRAQSLLRNSEGLMPTCSLKYFPRNDWLGKHISSVISLMVLVEFLSSTRSSRIT